MEREQIADILLLVIAVAACTGFYAWWYLGNPFAPGEAFKDEIVRQYGASRAWLYLLVFTLVCVVIWLVII
ncbi:MAG: hypothetical protein IPP40_15775 [bacterium]|nr:hypothetical protein [bacterium]